MKIFAVQFDVAWHDKPANYARVRALLDGRTTPGGLIVLPEMFATGFSMDVAIIGEDDDGPTWRFLAELTTDHRCTVIAGLTTIPQNGQQGRNEAVILDPRGQRVARYAKIHPFTPGGESDHYEAGQQVVTVSIDGWSVAPFICYDLRFPEIFRSATFNGADLLVVIANWPAERQHHWVTLLAARAIENQAYVVGVNRVGRDPQVQYTGQSLIIDPRGRVLSNASSGEAILSATLDHAAMLDYRREFPALRDARFR